MKGNKSIWDTAMDAVCNHGVPYKVDIIGRTFILGSDTLIKDGKYDGVLGVDETMSCADVMSEIERLFDEYYVSNRGKKFSRSLFAVSKERKDRNTFLFMERTDKARLKLELFILMSVLAGTLTPDVFGKHWHWQSSKMKDLIIQKRWLWKEY